MKFNLDRRIFPESSGITLECLLRDNFEKSDVTDSFVLKRSDEGEVISVYKKRGEFYYSSTLSEYHRYVKRLARSSTDSTNK